MITVTNLTKTYGKITALDSVTCTFGNDRVVAIMGENGAGKSTLLKICAGILSYDRGKIQIDDFSLKDESIAARKRIGFLPEMPDLYDRITGREFLYYIASLRMIPDAEATIAKLSTMIGIADFLDYEIGGYSKGMKQKISLISALMHNPQNLLLDEPVYGLDPLSSRTIQEFITTRKGTTNIATHSTHLVESIADEVYFLMRGRMLAYGHVSDLVSTHGTMEEAYFATKDENHV